MLTPIFAILWKSLVIKLGIHLLSPADNDRVKLATMNSVINIVIVFSAAGTLLAALGFLALPLKMAGWVLWTASWLFVFGAYFGLGVRRSAALYGLSLLGQVVFRHLIPYIPFGELSQTVEPLDMWRVAFWG